MRLGGVPLGGDWRTIASAAIAVALSVLGFGNANGWERWVFASAVLGSLVWAVLDVRSASYYGEPRPVRRRVHKVLEKLAKDVYRGDESIQITLFLPRGGADGDQSPLLFPIVRYWGKDPTVYSTKHSRARFKTDDSKLIAEAWRNPGTLYGQNVPVNKWANKKDLEGAQAWYGSEMNMPLEVSGRLSDWTLRNVKCIAVVGLRLPYGSRKTFGIISVSSENVDAHKFDSARSQAIGQFLETVAMMVAPMED